MNDKIFTRSFLLPAILFFSITAAYPQRNDLTIKDLVYLTAVPPAKFDAVIAKKGFKVQAENMEQELSNAFYKFSKDRSIQYSLERSDASDELSILFQTNSFEEFKGLKFELEQNGFQYSRFDSSKQAFPEMYQRGNLRIFPSVKTLSDEKLYCFNVQRKDLPHASAISYAENLRQITSHEYLASVFGPANVLKDRMLFSDKEMIRCSVLYPNTSLQVIFVWKDEENFKDISYLLIGGQLRTQSSLAFNKPIQMNKWRSQQGVYLGMSLRDLELLNGAPIEFYGWESDQPGMVSPSSAGKIDFKGLGVQLTCLDCNEDKYYSRNKLLNSSDIISLNGRVYVSTLVLFP
ncbi:MAG TPA: hypothetical protein VEZ55_13080 [Chitinophagaceae bacterium]|nr:hypothetical protein [Chitinophagaceae bacterium]